MTLVSALPAAAGPDLVGDGVDTLSTALFSNLGVVIPAALLIVAAILGVGFLIRYFRRAVSS
jgi:hypothetical protein